MLSCGGLAANGLAAFFAFIREPILDLFDYEDDEEALRKKRHADLLAGLIPDEEQTDEERAFLGKPKKGFIGPIEGGGLTDAEA